MKIGVALSGCDIGAVATYGVLQELEDQGFQIGMISCSGLPSVTALLYAYGYDEKYYKKAATRFLRSRDNLDKAVADFADDLPTRQMRQTVPFAASAMDITSGKICAFTDNYTLDSGSLISYPLEDIYDALSATISPAGGLVSYQYGSHRLCDFSASYGAPVYPLKMLGFEKIISVAFVPEETRTPYEALVKKQIAATHHQADVHITIVGSGQGRTLPEIWEPAKQRIHNCIEEICVKIAF